MKSLKHCGSNLRRSYINRLFVVAAVSLLLVSLSTPAFSQGGFFATVSGTVTDSSGALIPGVSVKATAVDTSVVTSTVTNESGSYNFPNLLPGKYTLNAALPGFQTKNLTNIELSQNTSYRYNFELTISGVTGPSNWTIRWPFSLGSSFFLTSCRDCANSVRAFK